MGYGYTEFCLDFLFQLLLNAVIFIILFSLSNFLQ